jgi:hypothetical protein
VTRRSWTTLWIQAWVALAVLVACGGKSGSGGGGGDNDAGGGGDGDGGMSVIDAPPFSGMCTPAGPQCSNCEDDDGDGRIDGFDPQCTGPRDNDERTFATGIPGDNKDAVAQDCFFDGNSGGGNDGCNIHVCCLLGAATVADCPIGANRYVPAQCPPPIGTGEVSQRCIDRCGKLTPPGCDCFGCCTICDPASNNCFDILINPLDSVGCDSTNLSDPTKCLRCTKNTACGPSQCGGETCVLCPGQDPEDLPMTCNGTKCPDGATVCTSDSGCPEQSYCAGGCCVDVIL